MNRDMLETRVKIASQKLRGFPRGPMGLTPDAVKFSPEYRAAKTEYNTAFQALRAFNIKSQSRG